MTVSLRAPGENPCNSASRVRSRHLPVLKADCGPNMNTLSRVDIFRYEG